METTSPSAEDKHKACTEKASRVAGSGLCQPWVQHIQQLPQAELLSLGRPQKSDHAKAWTPGWREIIFSHYSTPPWGHWFLFCGQVKSFSNLAKPPGDFSPRGKSTCRDIFSSYTQTFISEHLFSMCIIEIETCKYTQTVHKHHHLNTQALDHLEELSVPHTFFLQSKENPSSLAKPDSLWALQSPPSGDFRGTMSAQFQGLICQSLK